MVQCCLCAIWHHYDCVGLKKNDAVGVWPCLSCRMMPSQIRSLQKDISQLMRTNYELKQSLENIHQLLLTKQTTGVSSDDTDSDDDEDEEEEDEVEPSGTLLLGDSIIRNVRAKSDDLKVNSISGAKFCDLKKILKSINPKKEKYSDMYIICGTNDLATKKTVDKIIKDCATVIQLAKQRATNVHLSSILPRNDERVEVTKIDAFNLALVTLTNQEDVEYINNDKNFLYRDNSIDITMLSSDGLHLSALGTERLLSNLELRQKAEIANVLQKATVMSQSAWDKPLPAIQSPPPMPSLPCNSPRDTQPPASKTMRNPLMFKGAKCSFSNFFPVPIKIWNIHFKSTEHAYQFRKAIEMGQHAIADDILRAPTGWKAMDIAESITTNDHWSSIKQSVMYQLLQVKAEQCSVFHQDSMASKGQTLVENTTHEFWGKGQTGDGLNMLGRLLMVLREKLPDSPPPAPHSQSPYPTRPHQAYHRRSFPTSRSQQPRCFNCGERSHNINTCRHRSPLQCYLCKSYGHKQKYCRNNAVLSH